MQKHRSVKRLPRAGEQVLRLRLTVGVNQSALASAIGCSQPFLSMVENGARPIEPRRLAEIETALKEIARRRAQELSTFASSEMAVSA